MNNLYEEIISRRAKISVIGLGYVGMPIAVAFARCADVIGFDVSREKIFAYQDGNDLTNEIGNEELKKTAVVFTSDPGQLKKAKFHIVAVPTPIHLDKSPNLQPLISASQTLGENLTKGSIVVYESTVYPGVTEKVCIPILEEKSGLKYGYDFFAGYSPERINPGDKINRLDTIVKIVSGTDEEVLDIVAKVYEIVAKAGVYKAQSIIVAEAAKVIENSQRDINIAFMNEIAMIFGRLGIDTQSVLDAAKTKWNFLNFSPGLVGGHCIGVDPYYLTYHAAQTGYQSEIILAGRRINDDMGKYIASCVVKQLLNSAVLQKKLKVAILGFTFKENCNDCRNTRVIDIISELLEYRIEVVVCDPFADKDEVFAEYGITLVDISEIADVCGIVVAVAHDCFKTLDINRLKSLFCRDDETRLLIDIKGVFDKKEYSKHFRYWRL